MICLQANFVARNVQKSIIIKTKKSSDSRILVYATQCCEGLLELYMVTFSEFHFVGFELSLYIQPPDIQGYFFGAYFIDFDVVCFLDQILKFFHAGSKKYFRIYPIGVIGSWPKAEILVLESNIKKIKNEARLTTHGVD